MLAIEDAKPAASGSDSSSDSSSSTSGDSTSNPPQAKQARPIEANDLELAEAQLQQKNAEITALKAEFEGIFSALCHTSSELQKANSKIEEQKSTIALLTAENEAYAASSSLRM